MLQTSCKNGEAFSLIIILKMEFLPFYPIPYRSPWRDSNRLPTNKSKGKKYIMQYFL